MPDITLNLFLVKVFVLELFLAETDFLLLFITFILIQSWVLSFLTDSVALFSEYKLLPPTRNLGDLDFEVSDALIIDCDAHSCASACSTIERSLHTFFSVLSELSEGGTETLDSISEVTCLFKQVRVVNAELGVHDDIAHE